MVLHEDAMKAFLPKEKINFIIMGTMVAINARSIDGSPIEEEVFYYNNNRNHFWKVMQHLMEANKEPKKFSIKEKKDFLNKHGIAIINLVQSVEVKNSQKLDPSDTVLFESYSKGKIGYKKLSPKVKKALKNSPIFFTCRNKKGIQNLIDGFWDYNKLEDSLQENIWFLPTPTRCNPLARSKMWKSEILLHLKNKGLNNFFKS